MAHLENQPKSYTVLFSAIDEGMIKIPEFQRDFVWDKVQTAHLIDSILKGFPIGTFILWTTQTRLPHMRNIGNIRLPEPREGYPVQYVLDGQQRMTSLYAVRKGVRLTRDGAEVDYKDIAIDLSAKPDDDNVVLDSIPPKVPSIPVWELLSSFNPAALMEKYNKAHINLISTYYQKLSNYQFSTIVLNEYDVEVATEVFTRINTGGQKLTLFEIMVAKTFHEGHFDLAKRFQELLDKKKGLKGAGYGTIPPETVLQCVSAVACGSVRRQDILSVKRKGFIDSWEDAQSGLFYAVEYLKSHLGVRVSGMLPYNALLIPYTWFFWKKQGRSPSQSENARLRQYFYWASLTNRFRSGVGSKIAEDIGRMEQIIGGCQPEYDRQELSIKCEDLAWRRFSAGNAFTKAIVCLLSEWGPRRFDTHGKVELDNNWLKQANSKNYHHFFPRAFLRDRGFEQSESDSIMNIVLVDDYLNKRVIHAKPPSRYVADFRKENKKLPQTLKTHFIKLDWGVLEDDYRKFVTNRARAVAKALNKVLAPDVAAKPAFKKAAFKKSSPTGPAWHAKARRLLGKGQTQEKVAQACGVSRSSVASLVRKDKG